jgi:outer membrane protein W
VKTLHCLRQVALAAALVTAANEASAQTGPRLVRGDLSGTAGWLSAGTVIYSPRDSKDWHSSLFGTVSAGWYWTDNLKTEIDVGAGTQAAGYRFRYVVIDGRPTYRNSDFTFSRRILGISQQYQFFQNAWFHPYVAAGANLTWERSTEHFSSVFVGDLPGDPRGLPPTITDGPKTTFAVRPLVGTGFKAYMTPRSFFRTDLRVRFHGGPDETLLRFGFGIDF